MHKTLLTGIALFIGSSLVAQAFTIPDYQFKTKADYREHHAHILQCIEWLESTPYREQILQRQDAHSYLLAWLEGTPDVTVELQGYVVDLTKKNPELLILFFGGWIRYSLNHPDHQKGIIMNHVEGLESLVSFYKKNVGAELKKNNKLEKLVKMSPNQRQKWVADQI